MCRTSGLAWDEHQARGYLGKLQGAFARLGQYPELGVKRDDLSPGVRSIRSGSHIIFYEVYPDRILVLRVIHQRMDARSTLND